MPYSTKSPPTFAKNMPAGAKKIAVSTMNAILKDGGSEKDARMAAISNIKEKHKKSGDKWIPKAALIDFEMIITKASVAADGTMRWAAVASDTDEDKRGEHTTISLFRDWVERINTGKSVSFLSYPRVPFLGLSHYPSMDGAAEAGLTEKAYIDRSRFKIAGTFYGDDKHPLGKALFEAVKAERDLIKRGDTIEKPIRISAAWWDLGHAHGDFVFERTSLSDVCSMCEAGHPREFLKGQLDHFAATRVPINPRTSLSLEEQSMATRKSDAASIVGDELADELEAKVTPIEQSEVDGLPEMIVQADEGEPGTEQMAGDEMTRYMPLNGAITFAEAEEFREAQEREEQVYTNWYMFQTLMENIFELAEPGEVKTKANELIQEFGGRIAAIKSNIEDAYLVGGVLHTGGPIMADEKDTTQDHPADVMKAEVDATLGNDELGREQKLAEIQKSFENYAKAVKVSVDAVAPPSPGEAIQQAMLPIVEKLDLMLQKIGLQQQASPAIPQQKSFVPQSTATADNTTQKPPSLREMVRRSVGIVE